MKAKFTPKSPGATTSNASESVDIYLKITNLFIEKIEQGVNPWNKTWSTAGLAPQNYFTKSTYQGINLFLLALTPYDVPFFCTFNQIKAQGGKLRAGAKSLPVVYWNVVESKTETVTRDGKKEPKKNSFIKYYNVFNVRDVEGIDFVIPQSTLARHENQTITVCENLVAAMPQAPVIRHSNKNAAYYVPSADYMNMPDLEQFTSSAEYYKVLFHELTHATGHPSRLNREGVTQLCRYGSTNYSKEELVAELGASFLSTFTGIATPELLGNAAAYLEGWLRPLKEEKKFIFWAAKEAQKAVQFISPTLTDWQSAEQE
ncbi:zincin-like metallopeptidase domain-containing protein [Spirosoma migulaei]